MFTEAGYLLFWSLALSVLSGLVLAWPLGRALGKGRHARPGFFRLALLCALSQFSALALHVLGGMALGMPRPPIRPEPLSWLINAALLALCFVFWRKRLGMGTGTGLLGAALWFTALVLILHLALLLIFLAVILPS